MDGWIVVGSGGEGLVEVVYWFKSSKRLNVAFLILTALIGIWFSHPGSVKADSALTVNATQDTVDVNPGDGSCADAGGLCSIRAALMEANALSGMDTVLIPLGTYTLSSVLGQLEISSDIKIVGSTGEPEDTIIRAASDASVATSRVLSINPGMSPGGFEVVLKGLTISNGKAPSGFGGGGIDGDIGTNKLEISDTIIENNSTFSNGFGGGVYLSGAAGGSIKLSDVIIRNNKAGLAGLSAYSSQGGGVFLAGDMDVELSDVSILTNASYGLGGGMAIVPESDDVRTVTIKNSTFTGNTAVSKSSGASSEGRAGGLYLGLPATIQDTTISGNTAGGDGGGLVLDHYFGTVVLDHVSVTGNTAELGGGIYVNGYAGPSLLNGTSFTGNIGGETIVNPDKNDPDLQVAITPGYTYGALSQGQDDVHYTVTVSNGGKSATAGTVTMAAALPAGLTATAMTGSGWTCTVASLTCTTTSIVSEDSSFPAIDLTVTVADDAASPLTSTVTVSGGSEVNTFNSSASHSTTVIRKIASSAIAGVTVPVTGATPVSTLADTAEYTATIGWSPAVDGTFAGAISYTATITLTPKSGYTLDGVSENFFTVAGATSTSNAAGSGVVTAVFPATAAVPIGTAAIAGVTAPVTGATPVSSLADTSEYTATIGWSPTAGTFAGAVSYTATITLTPKSGYTLDGVSENFFTVAGATSTSNAAGSGVVTAVFPATAAVPVGTAAITGVTAPVTGATPVSTLADTAEYTATIEWTPAAGTFAGAVSYTATITLTPKSGYTLDGVTENFFTVAGATSTSNAAGSGVVTAVFPATAAVPIGMAAIAGVTVPVTGATPVSTLANTAEYTATIEWTPAAGTFAGAVSYTVTITLTPKSGYTLDGVAENFFTVAGATSTSNAAGSGVVTAVFPATAAVPIGTAAIAGVTAPVTGATPVSSLADTAEYTATIEWSPAAGTFAGAVSYTATITLTPKEGYTLAGVSENFFTVAGATSTSNAAGSGVVTAVFPATAAVPIGTAAIAGVTAPVTGATPVSTLADTAEYTATIEWSPANGTFAGVVSYTATITLTPKEGYTLAGVSENFFTVAGATSTLNAAGSGVVTAVFPATAAVPIGTAAIAGVTAPVTGATPVSTLADTSEYTATIGWSPTAGTFAGAVSYTATITLTPKSGYTLDGVTENFFTVAGATSTSNAAGSGVVTAVFPATAAVPIGTAAIAGVTAPVTGATPVSTLADTAEYTATIEWSPAVDGTFAGAISYTATITLTPKSGYTLDGVTENFFTVAGATSTSNAAGSGVVTAVFPTTAAVPIGTAAIAGVTAPVAGETPVSTLADTVEYTATIEWSPAAGTFAGAVSYTATITLTPKSGYTLDGVSENFFTVAGATSTSNAAGSGVVTAVFPATAAVPVTSITVTTPGSVTNVVYGSSLQLSAEVAPANAANPAVTWSVVSGTGAATITQSGELTATGVGTIIVKATAKDGSGVYGTKSLTISGIPVTGITVKTPGSVTNVVYGSSLQLSAEVAPANATNSAVTWSVVSGTGTANINQSGVLTATGVGTVTVKASANDSSGAAGTIDITITPVPPVIIPVTSILVTGAANQTSLLNGSTLQMSATVLPSNATYPSVTWSVYGGTGTASISPSGLLTATGAGTITVKAAATDGSAIEGTKLITVTALPEVVSIKLNPISVKVQGEAVKIMGTTNLSSLNITMISPNGSVLTAFEVAAGNGVFSDIRVTLPTDADAGVYRVIANQGDFSDETRFTVLASSAFNSLDGDHSGQISVDDIVQFITGGNPLSDFNSDGMIDKGDIALILGLIPPLVIE
jgi:hypothetical protein